MLPDDVDDHGPFHRDCAHCDDVRRRVTTYSLDGGGRLPAVVRFRHWPWRCADCGAKARPSLATGGADCIPLCRDCWKARVTNLDPFLFKVSAPGTLIAPADVDEPGSLIPPLPDERD